MPAPSPGDFARVAVRARREKLRREVAELDPGPCHLTDHACDRAWEMGVPAAAIAELIKRGSSVPLRSSVTGRTGQVHRLDELDWCVVMSREEPGVVVTVLFKTYERYERDGRSFRPVQAEDT